MSNFGFDVVFGLCMDVFIWLISNCDVFIFVLYFKFMSNLVFNCSFCLLFNIWFVDF